MEIINCTPHAVVVRHEDGTETTFQPSGIAIRLESSIETVGSVNGIQLSRQVFGEAIGLPEQNANTILIVSALVRSALPERTDLISPDTSRAFRDEAGRIEAVPGFISN